MPMNIDFLTDGVAPGADGINDLIDSAADALDAADTPDIRRGAFGRAHGAPIVVGKSLGSLDVNGAHGLHEYDFDTFGSYLDYDTATDFTTNGGTATSPVSGSGTWILIGHPDAGGPYVGAGGPQFLITFDDQFRLDGAQSVSGKRGVNGVLLSLNVCVHDEIFEVSTDETQMFPVFCLQYRTEEDSTWRTISRSIRYVSISDRVCSDDDVGDGNPDVDVAIRCLLTADDLNVSTHKLHSVRAMVALASSAGPQSNDTLRLRECYFAALPLRMELA